MAIIGHKGRAAGAGKGRFHHRMPAGLDGEIRPFGHFWPAPATTGGQFRARRMHIQFRHGGSRCSDARRSIQAKPSQMLRDHAFSPCCLVASFRHLAVQFGQCGAGEAHGIRHGLAMDRALRAFGDRGAQQFLAGGQGHFREKAKLLMVTNAQSRHAPSLRQIQLQGGNLIPPAITEPPQRIQFAVIARGNQAAIFQPRRQGFGKCPLQFRLR